MWCPSQFLFSILLGYFSYIHVILYFFLRTVNVLYSSLGALEQSGPSVDSVFTVFHPKDGDFEIDEIFISPGGARGHKIVGRRE